MIRIWTKIKHIVQGALTQVANNTSKPPYSTLLLWICSTHTLTSSYNCSNLSSKFFLISQFSLHLFHPKSNKKKTTIIDLNSVKSRLILVRTQDNTRNISDQCKKLIDSRVNETTSIQLHLTNINSCPRENGTIKWGNGEDFCMSFMMNNTNKRPISGRNNYRCIHHLEICINLRTEATRVIILILVIITIRTWQLIFARNPLKKEWWNTPLVVAKVRVLNIIGKRLTTTIRVSTIAAAIMLLVNILRLCLLLLLIINL